MTADLRVENIELRAAPMIAAAGGDPRILAPAVREAARESPTLTAVEVVAVLQAEMPEAFTPAKKAEPPAVDPSKLTEAEKVEYISAHGLDAYGRLLERQSELRRADLQRAGRGF